MNGVMLVPDAGQSAPTIGPIPSADAGIFDGLVGSFRAAQTSLERAQSAEHAFVSGNGDLQAMVFERARADAILNVASSAATKATQSLNTILNMQV